MKKKSKKDYHKKEGMLERLNNSIYKNFLDSVKYLWICRNYVYFSFLLFVIVGVFGYFFPIFFVNEIMLLIEKLIDQTRGLNGFQLIAFIINNNVMSSFFGMMLGFFFGIFSFLIIVLNAYVLGFVASKTVGSEGIFVLWKLFPHGIFEIPAIMISVGVGLRLGMFLFIYSGKHKLREFFRWVLNSIKVFVFIVIPLLVIAGIIEGTLIWLIG